MLYDPKWEKKAEATTAWREHLLRAADIVRERGLAKCTQLDERGRVCVHGAISIAVYGRAYGPAADEGCLAAQNLCKYLIAQGAPRMESGGAAYWNNMPERTKEEVIAALEGAARS